MILYPQLYLEDVTKITIELLKKHNIKALILDMDNTLLDYGHNILEGAREWIEQMHKDGIKTCIVSNSNKKEKLKSLSQKVGIEDYVLFAMKPFKKGVKKAIKILNEKNENIAVIGDQIFTDIIVANRCKMFSILVEPIKEEDVWITRIKRPIEKLIIKKYLNKRKKGEK